DANMDDYWKAQGMNPDGSRNPEFERLLDVENLIDYMLLTYFTGDRDGPGSKFTRPRVNNYFAILNRENPDGFKFFEHDSEHSLDVGDTDMVNPLTDGGAQFRYFNPHWMHEQLAASNSVYRRQFADRVYEQLFNDGLLTPEYGKRLIDSRAAEFDMAIIAESARWGDAQRGTPYTKNDWQNAVNSAKNFLDTRANVLLNQLRGQRWYPNVNAPNFLVNGEAQFGGRVNSGDNISFFASASTSFSTVLPRGSVWKYLDNGSNQGTAWRDPGFDDSSWKSGRAELGYGDTQVTTVGFGPNSSNKYVTTYFRTTFDVADKSAFESLQVRLQRDDGAVVYLNGQEIARSSMPGGTIRFDTFAAQVAGGGDETTFFEFDVDLARLQNGTNTIAVEIHQANANSSDISFDLELRGGTFNPSGGSIYYTTDGSDPLLPSGDISPDAVLYDGKPFSLDRTAVLNARLFDNEWSTITSADFLLDRPASAGDLVVSEINYNPHRSLIQFGEADIDKDRYEFVELLNISDERIDLTGVQFVSVEDDQGASEGISFVFDTQTLEPGERIVVAKDRQAFASRYGDQIRLADGTGLAADDGIYDGNLRNSGEMLTLLAADGSQIQQFEFDDSGSWPGRADGIGSTLEVIDPRGDYSSSQNFRSSSEFGGTPGSAGTGPVRNVVINELLTHTDLPQIDAIELMNTSGSTVNVGGWYISDGSDDLFRYSISILQRPLDPGNYLVIDETQLGFGFRGQTSDDAWLIEATLAGKPLRFADRVEFDAAQNGVSLGRWPNGSGDLFPMTDLTFGSENSGPIQSPVVISEVHYNPPAQDGLTPDQLEFVELWNGSNSAVDISNWHLDGGVDFNFDAGTILQPNERIVVASFSPTEDAELANRFRTSFGMNASARLIGPFGGQLDNGGEKVELLRPEDINQLGFGYVLMDRVDYDDEVPWPAPADGGGASLSRIAADAFGNFAASWAAAAPTPGAAPNLDNVPGDFNGDRVVNDSDIDLLCQSLRTGQQGAAFDLNSDSLVNESDFDYLITQILRTTVGDSNLDGVFDSGDLVQIFARAEYEDGIAGNSGWADGDWNCDGEFSSGDLVDAFKVGSYSSASVAVNRSDVAASAVQDDSNDSTTDERSAPGEPTKPSQTEDKAVELEQEQVDQLFAESIPKAAGDVEIGLLDDDVDFGQRRKNAGVV
ncbi:MAG: lamin tail domain-containing protein, partial [Planctomycetales bacterium]|nr:lamin tail domain-containing protein [Planctomycetales bacterium]